MPEKQSLRDITLNALEIEQSIIEADGEITSEIESSLALTAENLSSKIDGYALVIRRLEAGIEHHKQMMKDHSACIDRLENMIEWMESNLINASQTLDKPILNGHEFSAKVSLNKPSVEILDDKEISDDYKEEKITKAISKTKIKEALDIGVEVKGARLIQKRKVTLSLRKKQLED